MGMTASLNQGNATNQDQMQRFQEIIEISKQGIYDEINSVRKDIQNLLEEIHLLKKELADISINKTSPLNDTPKPAVPTNNIVNQNMGIDDQEKPKKKIKQPQSSDSINPDDVSIEKMFYFGNK